MLYLVVFSLVHTPVCVVEGTPTSTYGCESRNFTACAGTVALDSQMKPTECRCLRMRTAFSYR
jgi:hypothetical protein